MPSFFSIKKQLNQINPQANLTFLNNQKTLAYQKVNHIHNNVYTTISATGSQDQKANTLYYIETQKKYKVINYKNETIAASSEASEILLTDDKIPEILTHLAQSNGDHFAFYETPFDIIQTLRKKFESINELFLFSKKCKHILFQTVSDFNTFLNTNSEHEARIKYNLFLNRFKELNEKVEQHQMIAKRWMIAKATVTGLSSLMIPGGTVMVAFGLPEVLVVGSFAFGLAGGVALLVCGIILLAIGIMLMANMTITSSYVQIYSPDNPEKNSLNSLYNQAFFFTEQSQNEKENLISMNSSFVTEYAHSN